MNFISWRRLPVWILLSALTMVPLGADTIGKVEFVQQGGKPVVEDILKFNTRQSVGKAYDRAIVDEDIKRLYDTGYFTDVVAEVKPMADNKLELIFKLRVCPVVTAVEFVGNQKFRTDEFRNLVNIGLSAPLSHRELRTGANALRDFYKEKGYNDAEIIPELINGPEHTVKVRFNIKENLQLRVDNVSFEGNTVFRNWDLRRSIANQYSYLNWVPLLNAGLLNREELEMDKVRLRDQYWDKGYLDFKIEKLNITPDASNPEYVNLNFKLYEGQPYTVSKIAISGNKVFSAAELMALVTMTPGKRFDYKLEQSTRKQILGIYNSQGYSDATCQAVRHADFATREVEMEFVITEGRKYKVRQVMIVGNEFTKDKVIRRELVIYPDDPADANLVDVSKSRLMGMDMFEEVKAAMVNAEEIGQKDVVFNVKEKNAYEVRVGAGFSDVDSLFGIIEASSRNFDIANPSNYFRGGGQRVRIQAALGIERAALNFDFTEPWLFDIPLRLDISAYLRESVFDYWTEDRFGARVSLTKKFFDDFTSATLGYKIEQVNVRDMSHHLGPALQRERGREWVSQFSLTLDRTTLDSATDPTDGYQLNFLSAVSPKVFGSSESFYRLEGKALYVKSFLDKALIWHIGGRIGVVDGFDSKPAPLYERYFLGGGDTLRGFPFRGVGPLDISDHNKGGQSMMVLTTEITHPIWDFIRGAIFVDAGGAWAKEYEFSPDQFNIGLGYGLRIKIPQVPVPIKLDLAYPVLNQQDDVANRLRFHFNMGFSF